MTKLQEYNHRLYRNSSFVAICFVHFRQNRSWSDQLHFGGYLSHFGKMVDSDFGEFDFTDLLCLNNVHSCLSSGA